ncbi:MAG: hypothetical protein KF871_01445 [Hydrogenophaga sp.]|uniref:hypothetical protein n=1 Tax=Hydrogenophaga sp. TaxID=1904254 RepID=UPI001DE3025B|nr:hypothetical protein [Hydrogenophaga sp.]MBX3608534.1 hypothetical protein [Hydrogenophaga sp.]
MTQPETDPAPPARVPGLAALGRLVARSLGIDVSTLEASLQPVTLDELPDVTEFRRTHLSLSDAWDDPGYLQWRYRLGRDQGGFGELWRVRSQGRLLAILGLEQMEIMLQGEVTQGAQVMDLLVHPDAQESGLGVWINQALLARQAFTLAVGANQNSAGIVRRLFLPLAPRLTLTHLLDLRPFVERRWPRLARLPLATRLANVGLACWRWTLLRQGDRNIALHTVTRLDSLPAEGGHGPNTVQRRHSADYLQRRLFNNPRRALSVRLASRGEAVIGLIAWAVEHDDLGRPELHIVHWQHDQPDTFIALLQDAVRQANALRCTCVRVLLQDQATQDAALRVGFLHARHDPGRPCGVQASDADLAQRLARATWSLTDLTDDSDGY